MKAQLEAPHEHLRQLISQEKVQFLLGKSNLIGPEIPNPEMDQFLIRVKIRANFMW